MCANTTLMDQAVEWVIESTFAMVFERADQFESYQVENLLADVIHLDNTNRGIVGYNPDLKFDFPIGL